MGPGKHPTSEWVTRFGFVLTSSAANPRFRIEPTHTVLPGRSEQWVKGNSFYTTRSSFLEPSMVVVEASLVAGKG